jgi:general secretion pathway protein K
MHTLKIECGFCFKSLYGDFIMLKKLFLAVLASLSFSFALAAVDLNTATVEQLSTLKGIKAKKATAIVEYRQKNGAFKSVDDLKNVPGIGQKTVDKLRSELTVGGAAPAAQPKAAPKPAASKADKANKADAAK